MAAQLLCVAETTRPRRPKFTKLASCSERGMNFPSPQPKNFGPRCSRNRVELESQQEYMKGNCKSKFEGRLEGREAARGSRLRFWYLKSCFKYMLWKARAFYEFCCDALYDDDDDDDDVDSSMMRRAQGYQVEIVEPYFSIPIVTPFTSYK